METYKDCFGYTVEYHEKQGAFTEAAGHVLVICRYEGKWVLTNHKKRGIEFPGGKVEKGETPESAAIREVFEETGGVIRELQPIGEYKVYDPSSPFIKAVFYAVLDRLHENDNYMETFGPILLAQLPDNYESNAAYSFIMKDRTIPLCLKRIAQFYS